MMYGILPLAETERAYVTVTGKNETKIGRFIRLKEKSVGVMESLAKQFSNPGGLAVYLFLCTFAIAQACLKLPRNCLFVGCEVDSRFYAGNKEAMPVAYARQVRNEKSNNSDTEKVVEAFKMTPGASNQLRERKSIRS